MATDASGSDSAWGLTPDEIADFRRRGRWRRAPDGTSLCLQGEPTTTVALIMSGLVRAARTGSGDREVVLAVRGPGELVGELAALDGKPRSATISTIGTTEYVTLTAGEFNAFLDDHSGLMRRLLVAVVQCLRAADNTLVEVATTAPDVRVVHCLQDLCSKEVARRGGSADGEVVLPFTQDILARMALTTRAQVIKALAPLRSERIVKDGTKRKIVVLDPGRLLRYRRGRP